MGSVICCIVYKRTTHGLILITTHFCQQIKRFITHILCTFFVYLWLLAQLSRCALAITFRKIIFLSICRCIPASELENQDGSRLEIIVLCFTRPPPPREKIRMDKDCWGMYPSKIRLDQNCRAMYLSPQIRMDQDHRVMYTPPPNQGGSRLMDNITPAKNQD